LHVLPLLLARPWHAPSLLLAPLPSPNSHLIHHWSSQGSALTDWFLYLKPIPCTQLTHRPDDEGSKDLWNVGKLLPDYMVLQPRRQLSSYSLLWEPQIPLRTGIKVACGLSSRICEQIKLFICSVWPFFLSVSSYDITQVPLHSLSYSCHASPHVKLSGQDKKI
jgi:hypothetical protein